MFNLRGRSMEPAESSGQPLIILNPAANRGHMEHYRALMRSHIAQGEAEYVETSRSGEAKERALHAAREGRAVIIVGGDGSVNEVVNGILAAGRRVPLGIVAAGSGNDYAWNTLKLPRDPTAALERALHGRLIDTDAGIVNDQYFVNSFSIGLDANVAVAAGWLKKFPLMSGARLYYTATLQQLLFRYHRCPWLKFRLDGDEGPATERRYVLMAVTNGPTYGAGFRINPTADHCDGLFDICTIDYTPLLRALRLLPVVRRGEHSDLPEVTFYRAKTVYIESRSAINMQMDGETTSATTFDARILPGALCIRV
jgi:diacylglycerol kinase (ATP)